jgi:hypothetical protein
MSKKNKDHEKRRQKKLAKQKAQRGSRLIAYRMEHARKTAYLNKLRSARELTKGGVSLSPLGDDDYLFWLCHGANFLASDSKTGVWDPLFEDIYTGTLPDPESVALKVMDCYQQEVEAAETFGGVPRAVLAWTVTDRSIITIYKHEAVRQLLAKDPECDAETMARQPFNPTVWSLMDKVKTRSLTMPPIKDSSEVEEPDDPSSPNDPDASGFVLSSSPKAGVTSADSSDC